MKGRDDIIQSLPNVNVRTTDAWKWISNFTPHFTGYVVTYPAGITS